ncbi:MAG: hypothetical protein EOR57_15980 [Mesorhizobium sp.]|uniref:hypothetical protein n=1 Tax=Mesorhizobium sp. TaxID=1871066 RepID=UPI000FE6FA4C|nr:hypothetical protein [Mesorhizobium sp.]RWL19084.1 MAG: hypothetical protein EOR57_15980 [Mesorhizobium sp.]
MSEPGLSFGNITASGFSALEAAVLAYGLALAGRRGARTALVNLWRRISHVSVFATNKANPLRSILEQSIDIAELRKKGCPVNLSISASNARTDAVRVFSGDQMSIDAIVAAATVPFLFRPLRSTARPIGATATLRPWGRCGRLKRAIC